MPDITLAIILFILRVLAALSLIVFLISMLALLWRDHRTVVRELELRQRRRGQLTVVSKQDAPLTGTAYPLLPLTSIGRAFTNTITIDDTFASNEHALFTLRSGQWWLEDRGSSNGTLLNGYRIEEPTVISTGDIIGIGRIELKIELE